MIVLPIIFQLDFFLLNSYHSYVLINGHYFPCRSSDFPKHSVKVSSSLFQNPLEVTSEALASFLLLSCPSLILYISFLKPDINGLFISSFRGSHGESTFVESRWCSQLSVLIMSETQQGDPFKWRLWVGVVIPGLLVECSRLWVRATFHLVLHCFFFFCQKTQNNKHTFQTAKSIECVDTCLDHPGESSKKINSSRPAQVTSKAFISKNKWINKHKNKQAVATPENKILKKLNGCRTTVFCWEGCSPEALWVWWTFDF